MAKMRVDGNKLKALISSKSSVKDIATELGCTERCIYRYIQDGEVDPGSLRHILLFLGASMDDVEYKEEVRVKPEDNSSLGNIGTAIIINKLDDIEKRIAALESRIGNLEKDNKDAGMLLLQINKTAMETKGQEEINRDEINACHTKMSDLNNGINIVRGILKSLTTGGKR